MKNNILIFTTIFFGIFTFAQEEPETIVPENPEQLVNDSIDIQSGTIKNLQQAQERIDKLDTESKRLTNEYKDTIVEYEILNKYDNQLERITISQAEEIANITKQIEDLDETNKYVLPLLERMVITLRDLIEIDVPFLMDERNKRIAQVLATFDNPKVTASENVRQVLEAYNIEREYGRTIETYEDSIVLDGEEKVVNILRIGRLALMYQLKDQSETGVWNGTEWEEVSGYRIPVRDGIRMANKTAPLDLLFLPVKVTNEGGE